MNIFTRKRLLLIVGVLFSIYSYAQQTTVNNAKTVQYDSKGNPIPTNKKDSSGLQHRDRYADSITIFYRYYDSSRNRKIDSSINDFALRFPQPYTYVNLGNYGTAAHSLLFNPVMKPGWDAGLHQFDIYNLKIEDTKFFQTTRPYTELAYMLGSKAEQYIDILHTQNRKSNFNITFQYRLGNSPGLYRNQNASNRNLRLNLHYKSINKRYEAFLIYLSNKNASSENGGIKNSKQLDSLALRDPYELETRLGSSTALTRNPFNINVSTGNIYNESFVLLRHQYDFGQKDSIVTDSTVIKLFYPRLRLQHTFSFKGYSYNFLDNAADSTSYQTYFNYHLNKSSDTVYFREDWSNMTNEFSLITFPDKNNSSQFLKAGAGLQNFKSTFGNSVNSFYNVYLLGEYRNRTKNNVWDVEATGQLYLNGFNSGDYSAYISLRRQLSRKIGSLLLGFQNVNRTPSFVFDPTTNFPVNNRTTYSKENTTRLFAEYNNPKVALRLYGEYFLVNNYSYFDSFFTAKQTATIQNVLHIGFEKMFKLAKHFNWYTEIHFQQTTDNSAIQIPALLTRNRFAFEGNFYNNLNVSTGVEIRYYTNYKANNYSPFNGQFFYQNSFTTANRPDVAAYFNCRIKSFKGFVRLENLNTLIPPYGSKKYNYHMPEYPGLGLWFRFGIWWSFVN
jgi:hypothetical protein